MSPVSGKSTELLISLLIVRMTRLDQHLQITLITRRWTYAGTRVVSTASLFYGIDTDRGILNLQLALTIIAENARYSFLGIRQKDFQFAAETDMYFMPSKTGEEAGLVVMQNDRAAVTLTKQRDQSQDYIVLSKWLYENCNDLAKVKVMTDKVTIRVSGDDLIYRFFVSDGLHDWTQIGNSLDITFMAPGELRGFNYTGLNIGLYAYSNREASNSVVEFDRFIYFPEVKWELLEILVIILFDAASQKTKR